MKRPVGMLIAAMAATLGATGALAETRNLACRTTREVANISGGHVSFPLLLHLRIDEAANSYAESARDDGPWTNLCASGATCRFDAKEIMVSSRSGDNEVKTILKRDGWRYEQESQRGNVMSLTYGSCQ